MGVRKKSITTNCATCEELAITDKNQMLCNWGKGKAKILEPQKGKKPLYCKLIKS